MSPSLNPCSLPILPVKAFPVLEDSDNHLESKDRVLTAKSISGRLGALGARPPARSGTVTAWAGQSSTKTSNLKDNHRAFQVPSCSDSASASAVAQAAGTAGQPERPTQRLVELEKYCDSCDTDLVRESKRVYRFKIVNFGPSESQSRCAGESLSVTIRHCLALPSDRTMYILVQVAAEAAREERRAN